MSEPAENIVRSGPEEEKEEFTSKDLQFSIIEEVTKTHVLHAVEDESPKDEKTATNTQTLHNAKVEGLKAYPNQGGEGIIEAVDRAAEKILEAITERYDQKIQFLSNENNRLKEELIVLQQHLGLPEMARNKGASAPSPATPANPKAQDAKAESPKESSVANNSSECLSQFKTAMHQVLKNYPSLKPELAQLNGLIKELSWEQFKEQSPSIIKNMNKKAPESKKSMLELLKIVKK